MVPIEPLKINEVALELSYVPRDAHERPAPPIAVAICCHYSQELATGHHNNSDFHFLSHL